MPTSDKAGLTEQQEAFAVAFVRTANAAEAYRTAYNPTDPTSSWIYVEASQLLDHPKIAPRIIELRSQAAKRGEFTILKAAEEYEEARILAHGVEQAGAAVSATTAKVKLFGLDKPQQVQQVGKDGQPVDPEASSKDLARAIAAVLSRGINGGD